MIRHFISTVILLISSFHTYAWHHRHRYRKGNGEAVHRSNELTAEVSLGLLAAYPVAACGLEYKRYLGHDDRFSASCLLSAYYGGSLDMRLREQADNGARTYGYFAAPGMQYYFRSRSNRKVLDIGLGASVALGRGIRNDEFYGNQVRPVPEINHAFFGALIAQAEFNFHFRNHPSVVFGLFLNAGYIFSNARTTVPGALDDPACAHFGLRLGGKW